MIDEMKYPGNESNAVLFCMPGGGNGNQGETSGGSTTDDPPPDGSRFVQSIEQAISFFTDHNNMQVCHVI